MTDPLQAALQCLPHGPEFRFVDQLTALDPGKSGSGTYTVRGTEDFLRGHFPGQPLFPGVLLVEAIAQLAGVVAQSDPHLAPLKGLKLTAIRAAKIFGTAAPGETIALRAEITGRLENLLQAKGVAQIGERTLLQAEITLSGEKG
ncbi:MAG: 3-hydroxyacyl-ACP dehydratase FabZ family protein [Verrucomicrobiota bacterium]